VAVLDDQGVVESEQRYLPYGGERYAAGIDETDYGYTGQRDLQDLGLMDYNARFYSPTIRRLISADTLIPDPSSSQAFNRYSYVAGNPLVFEDPSGHYWVEDEEQEGPTAEFLQRFNIPASRHPGKKPDTGFDISNGPKLIKSGVSVAFCTVYSEPFIVEDSVSTGQFTDFEIIPAITLIESFLEPWANALYMEGMQPNVLLGLEYDLYESYTIPKSLTVVNISNEPIWVRAFELNSQNDGLEVSESWVLGAKLSDVRVSPGQIDTFYLDNDIHLYPHNDNLLDYYAELDVFVDLGILNTQWRIINNDLVAIGGIQCEGQ